MCTVASEGPAERRFDLAARPTRVGKGMDRVCPRVGGRAHRFEIRALIVQPGVSGPSKDHGAALVSKLVITNSSRQRRCCMSGVSAYPPHSPGKVRRQVAAAASLK